MMSSGMVGFRLNQQLTAVLTTLLGSSHTVVKALFLLQLCQDRAALNLDPQLLVPDVRVVLRYLLPAQLRTALEAWLLTVGETSVSLAHQMTVPPVVPWAGHLVEDALVSRPAVCGDGATVLNSAPGNSVRDEAPMMNSMHDVLDEGEEF